MIDRKRNLVTTALAAILMLSFIGIQPAAAAIEMEQTQSSNKITAQNMIIEVSKESPGITFFDPSRSSSVLSFQYTRLIVYNDTGNGHYDDQSVRYAADLSEVVWQTVATIEPVSLGGKLARVTMNGTLSLQRHGADETLYGQQRQSGNQGSQGGNAPMGSPATIANAVRLRFEFEIGDANASYSFGGHELNLTGGSEMKISIDVELLISLQMDSLCFEQALSQGGDSSKDNEFHLYEGTGAQTVKGTVNETSGGSPIMHSYAYTNNIQNRISYAGDDDAEIGYFTWLRNCEYRNGANLSYGRINTSYYTDGESLRLYTSSAINASTEIFIDPTIGIIPLIIDFLVVHLYSSGIGVAIGAVAIVAVMAVKWRSYGRRSQESLARLDDNPYYSGDEEKDRPNR